MNHFLLCDISLQCDPFLQMWPPIPNVTHFLQCDPFLEWPISYSVTHFLQCYLFFTVWPDFTVWPVFRNMAHFSKCNLFFTWSIFHVVHSSKFDQFLSVTHFPNVTDFLQCGSFFPNWTHFHFSQCDASFKVWSFSSNMTYVYSVTHFSQCDALFTLWKHKQYLSQIHDHFN